jgi:hypothetical protein
MDRRQQQLEAIERWLETASPLERFQVSLIFALVHMVFVLWLESVMPPVSHCAADDLGFITWVRIEEPVTR